MSQQGKRKFYDSLQEIFTKALMEMGAMGAGLMSQNELDLDEIQEVLEYIAKETEEIANLRGVDRDKFMREFVEKHLKSNPEMLKKFMNMRRPQGFTPNRPFQAPINHDPYNH